MTHSLKSVGLDVTPLIGARTGIGNFTYNLIEAIAVADPELHLRGLPITARGTAAVDVPTTARVDVRRRPLPAQALRSIWARSAVPPLEMLLRCDVFHATNYLAPRALRTPTVVTVHDLWFLDNPDDVAPNESRLAQLLPASLRHAAAIMTDSDYVRHQLLTWQPQLASKVTTVHLAPHPRSTSNVTSSSSRAPVGSRGASAGAPYVLVLGTVNRRKNVPLALDMLVVLQQRGSGLRLVIAGGTSAEVDLEHEISVRGLTEADVEVLGYADEQQLAALLENACALVSPSLHEGFGLVLIEAMQAGCPVVAVDGGSVAEVTAGAALLCEPDAGELADRVELLARDSALAGDLSRRGIEVARRYSWSATADQVLAVYRSVLS